MSGDDDELSIELEVLRSSYGPELEILDKALGSEVLRLHSTPCVGGKEDHVFVSVDVSVTVSTAYPAEPAQFTIRKSRGLGDDQLEMLRELLTSNAEDSAKYGEVHIFGALQTVEEFLTDRNIPNPCPVCFELVDMDSNGDEAMLGLNPCLHVIHAACYEGYRKHLYEKRLEKENTLVYREGPAKAARLAKRHWTPCPICRTDFDVEVADGLLAKIRNTA